VTEFSRGDGFPCDSEELQRYAVSFRESRILLTACELDVFSAIGEDGVPASGVAERIGADPGGTERLLHALCAAGLLEKNEELFSNGPASSRYLVRGKPDYVSLQYIGSKWDNWSLLTEAVRTGRPTVVSPFRDRPGVWMGALAARLRRMAKRLWLIVRRSDVWLRAFIDYMHHHARTRAAALVEVLDLSGVERVLDLGGGPAVYARAFARAKDGLKVTVFDWPSVVPTTRRIVSEAGLADRIDAIGGNLCKDELGSGYDLVLLSETAHALSGADNEALVRKAYNALNPGGQLVVQDYILDDDRTGPQVAAIFSLDMLMATDSGGIYTQSEVRGWLASAGISEIEQVEMKGGNTLLIGHKPTT